MKASTAPARSFPAIATWPWRGWLSFFIQICLVVAVEVTDDLIRGMVAGHDPATGVANALRIIHFEAAHGLWVEPTWQRFFEQTHHFLGWAFGWQQMMWLANTIYILGHVLVTFSFALWFYLFRNELFAFVRNIFFAANGLALVLYELYPTAPPRLMPALYVDGHRFQFIDTLYGILGADGKLENTNLGYNEFAAMPSLHMAWALIIGVTLFYTARPLIVRVIALFYPVVMLVTVVVTANHFLLDAVGAAIVVSFATLIALFIRWLQTGRGSILRTIAELWSLRRGVGACWKKNKKQKQDLQAVV